MTMIVVMIVMTVSFPFVMFRMIFILPVFGFMTIADHYLIVMFPIACIAAEMFVMMQIRSGFVENDLISPIEVCMIPGRKGGGKYLASAFPIDISTAGDIIIDIILR